MPEGRTRDAVKEQARDGGDANFHRAGCVSHVISEGSRAREKDNREENGPDVESFRAGKQARPPDHEPECCETPDG